MPRIACGPLQHGDVETGFAQAATEFRAIVEGNTQQDALAGENGDRAPVYGVVVRSDSLGIAQYQIEFRRARQGFAVFLRRLLGLREEQVRLLICLFARLIVEFDPAVPALRTDLADALQKFLDFVVLFPEPREAFPLIDVHSGKKIGNVDHCRGAAFRKHLRKSFSTNEIAGKTVR